MILLGTLADWYLEVAKEGGKDEILNYLLTQILKLWHPSHHLSRKFCGKKRLAINRLLMVQGWPKDLPARSEQSERI